MTNTERCDETVYTTAETIAALLSLHSLLADYDEGGTPPPTQEIADHAAWQAKALEHALLILGIEIGHLPKEDSTGLESRVVLAKMLHVSPATLDLNRVDLIELCNTTIARLKFIAEELVKVNVRALDAEMQAAALRKQLNDISKGN